MTGARSTFLWIARLEGVSFLILLAVAMPLKYLAGAPGAVRVVGMVHGVLFLAFVATLVRVSLDERWPVRRGALAFVGSLLPFGTFWFERHLRRQSPPP